jgi:peptidoglycan/xylan/chitin deacetylase (PgdA/CDA1 family)
LHRGHVPLVLVSRMVSVMRRHGLAAALALTLLAAGCATGPMESSESSAAPSEETAVAVESMPLADVVTTCTVPLRFLGKDVERLPVTEKVVALTFDAGANADAVRPILETLIEKNARATFFLTGSFVETYPKKSVRIARLHLVGNHTMTHPDLTTLSDLQVRRQVLRAERIIRDTTGQDPRRFFRFPFGAVDARTIALVNDLCYVPFRWTVDTLGWKGTSGGMTVAKVVDRVMAGARPGAIILMHVGSNPDDGSTLDADALPRIIRKLRAEGYTLVRLSRVLAAAP